MDMWPGSGQYEYGESMLFEAIERGRYEIAKKSYNGWSRY